MNEPVVERVALAIMRVETEDKISDYYKQARAAMAEIRDVLNDKRDQTSEHWATVEFLDKALK